MNARGKRTVADGICSCKMASVMALDGVTSFLRLKEVKNKWKRMRHSPTIGGIVQCNGGKLEEDKAFECVFVVNCLLESK